MRVYQYERGGQDSPVWIEISDRGLRFSNKHASTGEIAFSDLRALRYAHVHSPHRTDYSLLLCATGKTFELNYVKFRLSGAEPDREQAFNRAMAAILMVIGQARPDLKVISGHAPVTRWLHFACFVLPGLFALALSLIMFVETGGLPYAIPALGFGLASMLAAYAARPWRRQDRMAPGDLAALFEGDLKPVLPLGAPQPG